MACSDDRTPVKITVGFQITAGGGNLNNLEGFTEHLHQNIAEWSWTRKEFIIGLEVSPIKRMKRAEDTETRLQVVFDVVEGDTETSTTEAGLFLSEKIHSRTAKVEYEGRQYSVDPMTMTLIRQFDKETPETPTTVHHQWYIILAVVLAAFLSLAAVVIAMVMCMRAKRNGGYSIKDDTEYVKSNPVKAYDGFGPVVVVKEQTPPRYSSVAYVTNDQYLPGKV
jgi:hypothetical protein